MIHTKHITKCVNHFTRMFQFYDCKLGIRKIEMKYISLLATCPLKIYTQNLSLSVVCTYYDDQNGIYTRTKANTIIQCSSLRVSPPRKPQPDYVSIPKNTLYSAETSNKTA